MLLPIRSLYRYLGDTTTFLYPLATKLFMPMGAKSCLLFMPIGAKSMLAVLESLYQRLSREKELINQFFVLNLCDFQMVSL